MNSPLAFNPDWLSPPGETITDILRERNVTPKEFANAIGQPVDQVTQLIEGRQTITPTLAQKLESTLGGSTNFWLTREKHYREGLEASANLSADSDTQKWVESLPFKDMVRFGWVPSAQDLSEKVVASLRFFGVRDLSAWKQSYKSVLDSAVFRTSAAFRSKPGAVAAWLRRAEQESASIVCAPWDAKRLQQVLVEVRALTREPDPKVFLPHLKELLRPCGVAVVVLRAPDGCRASGATRFITANKALMLLSFRHLSDDQFWFSVLHEAGHLVLHKDRVMVDAPKMPSSKEEEEANVFAANVLVPPEFKAEMLRLPVNGREVMRFARRIGVSPGIVVGQMQYWHRLTHRQLNNLKRRYAWTDESKG